MKATQDSTRTTPAANGAISLQEMSFKLNDFAALLAGVENICQVEDIDGDSLNVAATVCRQINGALSKMADTLRNMEKKEGAV